MNRYLKTLGLAMVAALALSAVAASAASADLFKSTQATTVITANQEAENNHIFAIENGGEVAAEAKCASAFFAGTQAGTSAETLTVHPKYGGKCELFPVGEATIDTTGCNYILSSETEPTHAGVYIECEGSNSIKMTGPLGATITVHTQTVEDAVTFTNIEENGKDAVTLDITAEGIEWTCNFACRLATGLAAAGGNATYTGQAIATGYVDNGTVSGSTADGFVYNEGIQVDIEVEDT